MNTPPAAVLHVDLDGTWAVFEANGHRYSETDDPIFRTGLPNLLDLLDRHGIRATLFTVASDLQDPAKCELLLEAVRRGHEIASHTVSHPRLSTVALDAKRSEIAESRTTLQDVLNTEVQGFRAPSYAVDGDCLAILTEQGYRWDSSVFPDTVFAKRIGVDHIPGVPHRPHPESALVELPLPAYRPAPFPFHPCYSLILGRRYFSWGLARFRKSGYPLVLLFHLTDVADPLPSERLPSWKMKLMTLSHISAADKIARCDAMLKQVSKHYRWTDTAELVASVEDTGSMPC